MSTADLAPPRSLFIASPTKDFLFFYLSVSAVLIAWFCATVLHIHGFYILAAVATVSNGPHLISTWTRVYLPRSERFARPFHYWVVPALALVFAVTCYGVGEPGPTLARSLIRPRCPEMAGRRPGSTPSASSHWASVNR